jgi:hypothetical protein
MVRPCCVLIAGFFVAVLASVSPGFAQGGRAEINGTITDQGKAVLPGVNVTATNEANGLERTVVSGPDGRYIFPTLNPGTYTVKAELSGFQALTRSGLIAGVGQELTVNLTLQIAGVQETLTVTA